MRTFYISIAANFTRLDSAAPLGGLGADAYVPTSDGQRPRSDGKLSFSLGTGSKETFSGIDLLTVAKIK